MASLVSVLLKRYCSLPFLSTLQEISQSDIFGNSNVRPQEHVERSITITMHTGNESTRITIVHAEAWEKL